jgi:hypothetical protein
LDANHILKLIEPFENSEQNTVINYFSPQEQQQHSVMMKQSKDQWLNVAVNFSEKQIHTLIKFLTLAESQFTSWEAGEHSPVIYLTKFLRQNGTPLSRDLLIWIKSNSNNRYLPNGPL